MGFTIQDMIIMTGEQFRMELHAGEAGWANSISWVMMLEDTAIINNFKGTELAVTTGLGFQTQEKLLDLAQQLVNAHSAGLIINEGKYICEIPAALLDFCNENDLPLITVPWSVTLADMIKEISMRIFFQSAADEQIQRALIMAIENPENESAYRKDLLPYFDVDGDFQIALISTKNLSEMDTVERKKISYRLQIYLENITHNGSFLYYDGAFVLVLNAVPKESEEEIIEGMVRRANRRMLDAKIYVGMGSRRKGLRELRTCYRRAKCALDMAVREERQRVDFDGMGLFRALHLVEDISLLREIEESAIASILEYDRKHNANYLETLELYLKMNGSIQAVSEQMFTHRNTVIYRINNIKKILKTDLSSMEERMQLMMAIYIERYLNNKELQLL